MGQAEALGLPEGVSAPDGEGVVVMERETEAQALSVPLRDASSDAEEDMVLDREEEPVPVRLPVTLPDAQAVGSMDAVNEAEEEEDKDGCRVAEGHGEGEPEAPEETVGDTVAEDETERLGVIDAEPDSVVQAVELMEASGDPVALC